ncbi:MAG: thioredoxin family protein [Thermoanaerobaculum sp.]|nr:thioredoxin family protein [Thermoanaerobaculum sp.]MDW7967029.1 thioredoxin family protein [Thermoanaerobaculum sp.]
MALLSERDARKVKEILESLPAPVEVHFFTQELECQFCRETGQLLRELAALSPKLRVVEHDFLLDREAVARFGVEQVPAVVPVGPQGDLGLRLYGIPAGYEFASLLEGLRLAAGADPQLAAETQSWLAQLTRDLELEVYVTPTCPYCPGMVVNAFRLAAGSPRVRAAMVEATEFPHLAIRYQVRGVPRTVVNRGEGFIEGLVGEPQLVQHLRDMGLA